MSTDMFRLSRVKMSRIGLSLVAVLSSTLVLSACSSGITLFNNTGSTPYGQPGGGAMPTALPMPAQPFTGNQLAAAQVAAAQRPTYVYLPAPAPYSGARYAAPQQIAQPKYVAPKKPRIQRARVPIYTASIPRAGVQNVGNPNNNQGQFVTVRSGETLYAIAHRYRVNINYLISANNIRGTHVAVGQRLYIPGSGVQYGANSIPPRRGR